MVSLRKRMEHALRGSLLVELDGWILGRRGMRRDLPYFPHLRAGSHRHRSQLGRRGGVLLA